MSSLPNDEVFLDDIWCIYFHDPDDRDWTFSSYKKLSVLSSAEEFWGVQQRVREHVMKGMFFIMREHVFPCWDDPNNIDGGCLSFIVSKADVPQVWEVFCARLLTERLSKDPDKSQSVNGLSISPKNDFCIVKIWLSCTDLDAAHHFWVPDGYDSSIFTKNRAKIASAN